MFRFRTSAARRGRVPRARSTACSPSISPQGQRSRGCSSPSTLRPPSPTLSSLPDAECLAVRLRLSHRRERAGVLSACRRAGTAGARHRAAHASNPTGHTGRCRADDEERRGQLATCAGQCAGLRSGSAALSPRCVKGLPRSVTPTFRVWGVPCVPAFSFFARVPARDSPLHVLAARPSRPARGRDAVAV